MKPKGIPFQKLRDEWMKDPEFVREYKKLEPEFQIARQIMDARIKQKISQKELARRMGTGQAVVSRLEGANARPSISLLARLANALNTPITVTINPV